MPCDRIDYVEAKDWKPEALERAYCMDGKRGALHHELWQKLRAEGLLSGTDSRRIMADYQSCLDQQSLYSRILKNVHGREAPSCK